MRPEGRVRCVDCANYTGKLVTRACKLTRGWAAMDINVLGWQATPDWAPAKPDGLHRCSGYVSRAVTVKLMAAP